MEKSLPNGNGRGVVKSAQPSFAPLGHLPPLLWGKARKAVGAFRKSG
jgi:hypothetical protein